MSFPYKKTLVLGATSGIGLKLTERLVSQRLNVVVVGRRQEPLGCLRLEGWLSQGIDGSF